MGINMAKHEFGIMKVTPKLNERYDTYEPEKYDCISIDDDFIEPLLDKLAQIDCYWHTLNQPGSGLEYCGISLIPPSSLEQFVVLLDGTIGTDGLKSLLLRAKTEGKYVIHFGI